MGLKRLRADPSVAHGKAGEKRSRAAGRSASMANALGVRQDKHRDKQEKRQAGGRC